MSKSESFSNHRKTKIISGVLATSIILSTMFVKQHSVFDVLTAFLLAFLINKVVYQTNWASIFAEKERVQEKVFLK